MAIGGRILTTAQAADMIGKKPRTLEHWRFKGKGPRYLKQRGAHGVVYYHVDDLRRWMSTARDPLRPRTRIGKYD